jgi:hypothetical protein
MQREIAPGWDPESTASYRNVMPPIPFDSAYPDGITYTFTHGGEEYTVTGAQLNEMHEAMRQETLARILQAEAELAAGIAPGLMVVDGGAVLDPATGAELQDIIADVDPDVAAALAAFATDHGLREARD